MTVCVCAECLSILTYLYWMKAQKSSGNCVVYDLLICMKILINICT